MSEKLWDAFKTVSDRAFVFAIKNNPKHKKLQNFLFFLSFLLYSVIIVILLINIIEKEEGIVISVINSIFTLMAVVIMEIILELIRKKESIHEVITWYTEPTWKKFHKELQPDAGNRFIRIRYISSGIILFQSKLFNFLSIIGSIGVASIMQCFPSTRYQLPLPWHLPVKDYKNWRIFSVSIIIQTICSAAMSQVFALFTSLLIVYFLHVNEYLAIVSHGLRKLRLDIENPESKEKLNISRSLRNMAKMISSCVR